MDWCAQIVLASKLLPREFLNTLYMVAASGFFSFLFGLPIGIFLTLTAKGGLKESYRYHQIVGLIVNMGRSLPFAILIVAIIPFTRLIVGTSIGTTAAIIPLTLAAIPFIARVIEDALKEVEGKILEAAVVIGSTHRQIVQKILLPEALPGIIRGVTLTLVNLIGYSAMAGLVGGGGLGQVAIQYGYQRFNGFLMFLTVVLLLALVECVQWIGSTWASFIERKRLGVF